MHVIIVSLGLVTGHEFRTMAGANWPQTRVTFPFGYQNREVFTRKSSFLVIFFLAGDLV